MPGAAVGNASPDSTDSGFADFNNHPLIGSRLSCLPLVLNQREGGLHPAGRLRLPTPEADPAQRAKSSLSEANSRSQRLEIFIVADENGIKCLTDAGNNLVGRILWDCVSQENNFVTCIAKNAGY
jgi:hypothetical protein